MNVSKSNIQNFSRFALALAVFLLTLTPAFALTNAAQFFAPSKMTNALPEPKAVLKKIWVDYNVSEEGRRGMLIHVDFEVTGLKGIDAKLIARVRDESDEFLKSKTAFANEEGDLETSFSIKPGFPTTEYEDARMFLPYSELNFQKGIRNLKLDVDLKYETGAIIDHLTFVDFKFTAPSSASGLSSSGLSSGASGTAGEKEISATVNRVWVDYDVFENRRKGMRIHVSFEVNGLQDIDSKLTVRIRKEDDSFLISDSTNSNEEGHLQLAFEMKPKSQKALYKDAVVFLPYSEISLRKGVWNLKLDIDLNYANGEIIDHLAYHEFEFTR